MTSVKGVKFTQRDYWLLGMLCSYCGGSGGGGSSSSGAERASPSLFGAFLIRVKKRRGWR